jgi:hypothetical protein
VLPLLLALALTQTPQHRLALQPNLPRSAAFALTESYDFAAAAAAPSPPTCIGDAHCVALCMVDPASANWQCYDNTGAQMTGMTQGVGATYAPSFAPAPDGGWFQALNHIDDTSSGTAIPRIDNAAIRNIFGGDHTIIAAGYSTTDVNANGGWWGMITDGTNVVQLRHSASQFEFLESPGGITAANNGKCLLGWCVASFRRSSGTLTVRTDGTNSAQAGATTGNVTGSNAWYFGGGVGVCCTPAGAMGGALAWTAFYNEAKTDAQIHAMEKAWYGATPITSGGSGSVGTSYGTIIGKEAGDSGFVYVYSPGAYLTDPVLGIRSQNAMQNFWAADPLAAATWTDVATPTVTSNASAGPFFRWKNTNECDLIVDDNAAAFEGKESATAGTSSSWYNASCYLKAGTSGTTTTKARIQFVTDGTFDAGTQVCDVTGLTSTAGRYPAGLGCWAWIDNPTSVKADVLVGNATSDTGSITVCQCQLTKSAFPELPAVDNVSKGANWPELDGGRGTGGIANGAVRGKVEAVFQVPYTNTQATPNYTEHALASYVIDAYDVTQTAHNVLLLATIQPVNDGGTHGEPGSEAIMYGPSLTYENRFDYSPYFFDAGTFYVWSYEWQPSSGTLPDAGQGVGCRGLTRLDPCANPATCTASTIIMQNNGTPDPRFPVGANNLNSGLLGTCPQATQTIDIGTRTAGSSPSVVWLRSLKVYR